MERRDTGAAQLKRAFCRHCNTHQDLDTERIDVNQGRVWHRCKHCDQWFLVRWEDAAEMGVVAPLSDPSA